MAEIRASGTELYGSGVSGFGTFGGPIGIPLSIGTLCMFLTTAYFYFMSLKNTGGKVSNKYYYVSMSVTGIATLAYLCMRGNIGILQVECASHPTPPGGCTYPLFWMRYVDWFFTTPFFLLDLGLLAGADSFDTFYVMLQNALCITAGAVGALKPAVNVPMFIIGMATFVAFIHKLWGLAPSNDHYNKVMRLTMGIWCAYPIMFVLFEMTRASGTDVEVWSYMILDVAAKCGCGVLLTTGHEKQAKASSYGSIM
jgi:bacteriorhodopsin